MTCPGNPHSAGQLTQSWEEGLQEEARKAGCVLMEEDEEERKWNCLEAHGPKFSLVLFFSPYFSIRFIMASKLGGLLNENKYKCQPRTATGVIFLMLLYQEVNCCFILKKQTLFNHVRLIHLITLKKAWRTISIIRFTRNGPKHTVVDNVFTQVNTQVLVK